MKFTVRFSGQSIPLEFAEDVLVSVVKQKLFDLTGIHPSMQKLMFKGALKDAHKLSETKLREGAKCMLVGSTVERAMTATASAAASTTFKPSSPISKSSDKFCDDDKHKRIISRGPPEGGVKPVDDNKSIPEIGVRHILGVCICDYFVHVCNALWCCRVMGTL
jgi:hypothetical protein